MKPALDYSLHPAFSSLMPKGQKSSSAVQKYFSQLDDLWEELLGPEFAGRAEAVPAHFVAQRDALMTQLRPQLECEIDREFLPYVFISLDKSADDILAEINKIALARSISRQYSKPAQAIAEKLRGESLFGVHLEPWRRAKLMEILKPYMDVLREQRRTNGGARCFVNIPGWGADWNLITAFLRQHRIEEGISAFAGYPLGLVGYALTYSHPDETWFANCYSDLGLDVASTVQMHYDLDNLSAKSMLYIDEVNDDDGPFSYTPVSRDLISSRSQTSFFKYLDYATYDFAKEKNVGCEYRPIMSDTGLRKYFADLPAELQGTACPGDDVIAGSPLERKLLNGERLVTSDIGDLAVFAGGETLHRGGVVKGGERWALQMIYKEPFTFQQEAKARLGALLLRFSGRSRAAVH
jgi:hypothetical protein